MAPAPPWPYGPKTILGAGESSGKLGAASFSVTPRLFLNPSVGTVGSVVTVAGFGFGPRETVNLYWDNPLTFLGTATTNTDGTFRGGGAFSFTLPQAAPPGIGGVSAVGETTRATDLAYFNVE